MFKQIWSLYLLVFMLELKWIKKPSYNLRKDVHVWINAITMGYFSAVEVILTRCSHSLPELVSRQMVTNGYSGLHLAAYYNHRECAHLLITKVINAHLLTSQDMWFSIDIVVYQIYRKLAFDFIRTNRLRVLNYWFLKIY